jgi:hypothetical protein
MTNAEYISKLIDVTELLTERCLKIEKDTIQQLSVLKKRIAELEAEKYERDLNGTKQNI